jgi:subtilisin family serine protease
VGVTATITIEADDQEHLGEILSAIGRALKGTTDEKESPMVPEAERLLPSDQVSEWYRVNGRRFVARLTENAAMALWFIAGYADENVPVAAVASAVGKHGTALAGTLASIGAATRALDAPAPPFERDPKRRRYRMSPGLREVFAELIDP